MASIKKRGDFQWRAQIRRSGFPNLSKTFDTRKDAEDWSRDVERDMRRGLFVDRREAETTTLLEVLNKYEIEVTPLKKSKDREITRIAKWKKHKLASYSLSAIKPKDISSFILEKRKLELAENTIRLDVVFISSVFEHCRKDWGIEVDNPCKKVKLPKGSKTRSRRLAKDEEESLLKHIQIAMPRTEHIIELVKLGIETGMRESELLKIDWGDFKKEGKFIHLDDTKSGDPRDVPLSPRALKLLSSIEKPGSKEVIFKVSQDRLVRGFKEACNLAIESEENPRKGFMVDLSFHDLRHESASRWAAHLESHELCKMFGWKTMQMALRYYHPTGSSIAEKLRLASEKFED